MPASLPPGPAPLPYFPGRLLQPRRAAPGRVADGCSKHSGHGGMAHSAHLMPTCSSFCGAVRPMNCCCSWRIRSCWGIEGGGAAAWAAEGPAREQHGGQHAGRLRRTQGMKLSGSGADARDPGWHPLLPRDLRQPGAPAGGHGLPWPGAWHGQALATPGTRVHPGAQVQDDAVLALNSGPARSLPCAPCPAKWATPKGACTNRRRPLGALTRLR